jgi:hypothetical protein
MVRPFLHCLNIAANSEPEQMLRRGIGSGSTSPWTRTEDGFMLGGQTVASDECVGCHTSVGVVAKLQAGVNECA